MLLLVVGCSSYEEKSHTFTVYISAELSPELVEGVLEAIEVVNDRVGVETMTAVIGECGTDLGRICVRPGLVDSNLIGFADWGRYDCNVELREDAISWTTFGHEALHCFGVRHSDDVNNIMYGDEVPGPSRIADEQIAQVRAHLTW
jgi:hypothetical protein